MKYTELAPALAQKLSPRELAEAAEAGSVDLLIEAVGLRRDRAARTLDALVSHGVGEILTANVEDDVQYELLDGVDYKGTEVLSTGQRCTIVLPIIFEHRERVIIVDQPEDHLDNAFIVDTLVKSIQLRSRQGQLLVSTHNANIPVLGEAAQVILLESDGKRGFVAH